MSLPSQTARTSPAGRPYVYRRRSRRNPPPLALIAATGAAVVLGGLGLVIFLPDWGGPSEAKAETTASQTPVDPLLVSPLPATNREPAALVIEQGRPRVQPETRQAAQPTKTAAAGPATSTDPGADPGLAPPPLASNRGMLDEAFGGVGAETPAEPVRRAEAVRPPETAAPSVTKDSAPASATRMHLDAADALLKRNDRLAARQALWDAMKVPGLDELELSVLRGRLTELNKDLVFGPSLIAGDPLTEVYTIKAGDALARIARTRGLSTHWKLIQRVNGIASPDRIRVGQKIKLVKGPFHAVVDKSDFRLDLYAGATEEPDSWVFIRSFEVGLGEGDSTPTGHFIVRPNGKLENPGWVNPRNPAEKYAPDDAGNPIGEFWVGLDGLGDSAAYAGYGIHGTIDMDSIGKMRSMGCVRLRPDDIALIYECLGEGQSLVQIRR
jgi:LysM repeat protein